MQNSIMFCLFILKFTSIVDAYYKKNQYFFSLYTNFEIFQKFSVKIKIFLHILIVLIMYESGKVKKIQSNKIGITIYSWTVCPLYSVIHTYKLEHSGGMHLKFKCKFILSDIIVGSFNQRCHAEDAKNLFKPLLNVFAMQNITFA